jgi:hypothetical protein
MTLEVEREVAVAGIDDDVTVVVVAVPPRVERILLDCPFRCTNESVAFDFCDDDTLPLSLRQDSAEIRVMVKQLQPIQKM